MDDLNTGLLKVHNSDVATFQVLCQDWAAICGMLTKYTVGSIHKVNCASTIQISGQVRILLSVNGIPTANTLTLLLP